MCVPMCLCVRVCVRMCARARVCVCCVCVFARVRVCVSYSVCNACSCMCVFVCAGVFVRGWCVSRRVSMCVYSGVFPVHKTKPFVDDHPVLTSNTFRRTIFVTNVNALETIL